MQPIANQKQRSFGKHIIIRMLPNGQPRCTLGPQWPMALLSMLFTVGLITWLMIYLAHIVSPVQMSMVYITTFIYLYSYLKIFLSNPGFAKPIEDADYQNQIGYCFECKTLEREGVQHCQECGVCIQELDHHCPWIGKCIGKNNIKDFYFFLFMLIIEILACLTCLIYSNAKSQEFKLVHPNQ